MEKKGLIFGIQHFSIHDGPGIRSAVFLKGCPLRCRWCHNPEGLECKLGVQYYEKDCVGCGACNFIFQDMSMILKLDEKKKRQLVQKCAYHALRIVGKYMNTDEVIYEVIKDARYFKSSKGGITISGGEPMMQFPFTLELAKAAKESNISTFLETSGFSSLENYQKILPYIDTFLWDYKATGEKMHQQLVGTSNQKILSNLDALYHQGADIILRCPLIPNINDNEEHLRGIAEMYLKYPNLRGIEIMSYHKMGISKAKRIGYKQQEYVTPNKERKAYWKQKIEEYGGKLTRIN